MGRQRKRLSLDAVSEILSFRIISEMLSFRIISEMLSFRIISEMLSFRIIRVARVADADRPPRGPPANWSLTSRLKRAR